VANDFVGVIAGIFNKELIGTHPAAHDTGDK
jgi:hypothetical protein